MRHLFYRHECWISKSAKVLGVSEPAVVVVEAELLQTGTIQGRRGGDILEFRDVCADGTTIRT